MFRHILVATDLGTDAERAVELATRLAERDEAELFVLHVLEIPAYVYTGVAFADVDCLGPLEEAAQRQFADVVKEVRERCPRARGLFKAGTPWEQILATARETHADLVVVGTHGRRGVAHALIGSVAEKIVRLSPVPVLTVRQPAPAPGG